MQEALIIGLGVTCLILACVCDLAIFNIGKKAVILSMLGGFFFLLFFFIAHTDMERRNRLQNVRERYPEWKIESHWNIGREVVLSSGTVYKVILLDEMILERYRDEEKWRPREYRFKGQLAGSAAQ